MTYLNTERPNFNKLIRGQCQYATHEVSSKSNCWFLRRSRLCKLLKGRRKHDSPFYKLILPLKIFFLQLPNPAFFLWVGRQVLCLHFFLCHFKRKVAKNHGNVFVKAQTIFVALHFECLSKATANKSFLKTDITIQF